MSISLTFLGAAQNVTGSSYAVEVEDAAVLVDCGLYQEREFISRNWQAFPFPPSRLKAVLLTHAHLDHCGLLPKLIREGFRGPVYCSPATADIARIVLLDSAKIQEEDASAKARRHALEGRRGPYPEVPLYTTRDAEAVLPLLTPISCGTPVTAAAGIRAVFYEVGHILGSTMIKLDLHSNNVERTIVFTGDLGRNRMPILRDPEVCRSADYVVIESTYGDRIHEAADNIPDSLARILNETRRAGGKVVIPAFAIERTQELIYYLNGLLNAGKISSVPVFLDSPMAGRITEVFKHHQELFDEETTSLISRGNRPYEFPGMKLVGSVEESKAINKVNGPAVIIAGSGMCNGGRIKHHLVNTIGSPENTILFVGYQTKGTLGREILDGIKTVRILGRWYPVKARVEQVHGLSAHADRNELLAWLMEFDPPPRRIFVTHGDAQTAVAFAGFVRKKTGWSVSAPDYNQREEIE